jgi:hypothetical protein
VPFDEIEALGLIFLSPAVEMRNRNERPHEPILLTQRGAQYVGKVAQIHPSGIPQTYRR